MRQLQPVIWSKGTFLSPQHLQAQEGFFEDTLRFYLDSLSHCAWGFSRLQIDAKALSEGQLSLSAAVGLFPDALPVDIPSSDPAPRSRVLEECFRGNRSHCTFYLAIPQEVPGGMNVALQRGTVSTRFFANMQMLRDENSGTNEKPVQLARKNLQILADGEYREGSILLPCARIEKTEGGLYQLASNYVTPMISVAGNEFLTGVLRSLIEFLVARSSQISRTRRQKNQSLAEFTASDIANFWLLYTVNTHLPTLRHFFQSSAVHPERLYSSLAELAGALTAFSKKTEPRDLPLYDHDHLGECFTQLDSLLRQLLDTLPTNFVALALKPLRDTIYATVIEKDAYFDNSRFYLAISSEMREADLISRVPKLMKVGSATTIETLIRSALSGVRLTHVETPPRAIPVKLRYQYFSIERSGPAWEAIQRGRSLAVHAPSELSSPEMELIILLPSSD